ncbi:MAG: hypothetical protein QXD43_02180 [Candidatus Aenigmatarchaeota archaeon]
MKGQYLTLEYLIFFMIGIFLIISIYFSFSSLNENYRETILQNQLQMTGELISGTIVNVYEASNTTNSSINYTLAIPTKISNCIYSITVKNNMLNLNCTNEPKGIALTLYNINTTNKNIIYSTNGLIKLFAKQGKVELS